MIKKKFWKRSVSMLLVCSMLLGSSSNFQVGNVQAKEMAEEEAEAEQVTAADESDEAVMPEADPGQDSENVAEDEENKSLPEENGNTSISENETDEMPKMDENIPAGNSFEEEGGGQIQPEEVDDIAWGNVKEVPGGSAASEIISDTALLKGLAFCILGDESQYSSMTVSDLETYTGEIDLSLYAKASDIKNINGIGYAKKATAFNLRTCTGVTNIPAEEFSNCSMAAITFPETIVNIGAQAFYNCADLAKITTGNTEDALPSQLVVVGTNAFEKCTSLVRVIIPDTVDANALQHATYIFANCGSLQEVIIGSAIVNIPVSAFFNSGAEQGMTVVINGTNASLEKIGTSAFSNSKLSSIDLSNCARLGTLGEAAFLASQLESIVLPDSISNSDGNKLLFSETVFSNTPLKTLGSKSGLQEEKIIIPEYVSVTDKSSGIFLECKSITDVRIPASWELVPNSAFKNCNSLAELAIGNDGSRVNLTTIGEEAFYSVAFENVDFLQSCTVLSTIEKSAFEQCAALKSVVLPACVQTVGEKAFYIDQDAKKVAASTSETNEAALTDFQWSYDSAEAKQGSKRSMGAYALAGNVSMERVVLPDYSAAKETFEIGEGAFSMCIALEQIGNDGTNTLPASISFIGANAFKQCYGLTQIKVQAKNATIELEKGIFEECLNLTTVELPAAITSIPDRTFYNAGVTSLTIGTIPNKIVSSSLKTIGARSFFGCQIRELDLSGCTVLEEIGGWAFAQADTDASVPANQREIAKNLVQLERLILPESLSALFINSGAFCLDMEFTTLATPNHETTGVAYIPDYVSDGSSGVGIGEGTFAGTAISDVVIPAGWTGVLPKGTFEACENITNLDFLVNTNLSGLGEICFADCTGLREIHLANNNSIKSIGKNCFEGCTINSTKTNPMTLPASLTTIGEYAFANISYEYLDLSANMQLTSVGQHAFRGNTELVEVKLSPAMTNVPNHCFADDTALKTVDFQMVKEIGQNAFGSCSSLDLTGTNLDFIEKIGNQAFQKCQSLKNVKFGPNLVSIGSSSFYQCAEITQEGNVKSMDSSVKIAFDFSNASSLTTIGTEAFSQSAITEFDISKSPLEVVSNNVCKGCELLESATFGTDVKYIGTDVLSGCPKLEKVTLYSTTVMDPKVFNSKSAISGDTTNKRVSITVKPVKESIKIGIDETMDFPYYVHMVNTDKSAPELKAFRYIVAGDPQNPVPEADREKIYMAVSGDVEGYYINSYANNTTLIGGQYQNSEGTMTDNFQQSSHTKNDNDTNKKEVDVFQVTGIKEGSYPLYVCCQVQFPLNNSYDIGECIKSEFTTQYTVEVVKAWYKADLYQKYDSKSGLDDELKPGSVTNLQVDSKNEKPRLYYDFQYLDEEIENNNISDWNVTVVSDNPEVMYPGKTASDGAAKATGATPGTITTEVRENNKNNQQSKCFYLIPAGVGTAHITVYPASHPAGSSNAEKYAQTYTYVVGADLRSIQLVVPSEKRTLNPGQTAQIETKITNCLNQTATVTSTAELAKYTNNKLVYETDSPALLTINQNGLVKAVSAEDKQKTVNIQVTATKADGNTVSAKGSITVKWPDISAGSSYTDQNTGALVTVTKKGDKDGEVTYNGAPSTSNTTIKIPSTVLISGVEYRVTKIAPNAFKNNKKLKTVSIPSSVTEIGSKAFYNCTALKKVTIGSNVTIIGSSAFYNCKSLTSVTIGKNVTSIGSKAFYNCKKLKKITIKSTVLNKVGSKAFKNIYKKATIKVPKKKLSEYKTLLKGKGQAKTVKIKK